MVWLQMDTEIRLSALSPTMEKANVARWIASEGSRVRKGDVLAEIETDKATMEIEAPVDGVLSRILVAGGAEDVLVDSLIGIVSDGAAVALPVGTEQAEVRAATNGHSGMAPRFPSPLARRLAREQKLDLSKVVGSGPHGRIVARDIRGAARNLAAVGSPAIEQPSTDELRPDPASPEQPARPPALPGDGYTLLPHSSLRKAIAAGLSLSKSTVPHFYLSADCRVDGLLELRGQLNEAVGGGEKQRRISVNDMVVKALASGLQDFPEANVTWSEAGLLQHRNVDVSVAVSVEGGIITPVIRQAELKSLSAISREIAELAARARLRKLLPHEYQGGSCSVSNLGMHGAESFSAILNPPQSLILAVGAARTGIVAEGTTPVVAKVMNLTLSVDHRAIDGALAARLLASIKALVEQPLRIVV